MQFEKSGLRIIGTVGLMLGLSVGCSAPPKPQVAMQSVNCTLPEFAEGFRWRSCGGASDSGVKCLEILDAQRAAVMTTVYQDSAHWRNDSSIPTSEVVVLGEAEGLTTLSSTHVALIEVWNPSLSEWKGGGLLQYVESQEAQSRIKSSSSVDFGGNPEWNHEAMIEASFSRILYLSLWKSSSRRGVGEIASCCANTRIHGAHTVRSRGVDECLRLDGG